MCLGCVLNLNEYLLHACIHIMYWNHISLVCVWVPLLMHNCKMILYHFATHAAYYVDKSVAFSRMTNCLSNKFFKNYLYFIYNFFFLFFCTSFADDFSFFLFVHSIFMPFKIAYYFILHYYSSNLVARSFFHLHLASTKTFFLCLQTEFSIWISIFILCRLINFHSLRFP